MSEIRKVKRLIVLFAGLALLSGFALANEVPRDIINALNHGNAKELAVYFNQNVELVVLDNDNVYSKSQAQQIVSNFFSSFNPVEENAFSVIHNSGKEGAKYVIGKLKTEKGDFRVYFLLKQNNGKEYIHQLRIEKQ